MRCRGANFLSSMREASKWSSSSSSRAKSGTCLNSSFSHAMIPPQSRSLRVTVARTPQIDLPLIGQTYYANKRAPLMRRSLCVCPKGVCLDGKSLCVDRLVQGGVLVYLLVPAVRSFERLVDVVDVFYAGGVEPLFEGLRALGGVNLDAVLPGGAAAEDSVEAGAGLDG